MNNICYKVVLSKEGKFYSSNTPLGCGRLQYKIGQKTSPKIKNSKIFVFANVNDAKAFVNERKSQCFILKCDCEYSSEKCERTSASWFSVSEKTKFWNNKKRGFTNRVYGACLANWVKPIEIRS